jgi:hypothetical protein
MKAEELQEDQYYGNPRKLAQDALVDPSARVDAHYMKQLATAYLVLAENKGVLELARQIDALAEEIAQLKKALNYYADKRNYELGALISSSQRALPAICDDDGRIARAALKPK